MRRDVSDGAVKPDIVIAVDVGVDDFLRIFKIHEMLMVETLAFQLPMETLLLAV